MNRNCCENTCYLLQIPDTRSLRGIKSVLFMHWDLLRTRAAWTEDAVILSGQVCDWGIIKTDEQTWMDGYMYYYVWAIN